jgi:hypothetical protein
MTKFLVAAAGGGTFELVVEVDPALVSKLWEDIGVPDGKHGLLLLDDRRLYEARPFRWQVWTASVTSWEATDTAVPTPVPPTPKV